MRSRVIWAASVVVGPIVCLWLSRVFSFEEALAGVKTQENLPLLIALEGREFEADPVPYGAEVRHSFQVINALDEAIHVDQIMKSCGCTEAVIVPSTLQPGEQAEVRLTLMMESSWGKQVSVLLSSSARPECLPLELFLKGKVERKGYLIADPAHISLLSDGVGSRASRKVRLKQFSSNESFQPPVILKQPGWLSIELAPGDRSQGKGIYKIQEYDLAVSVRGDLAPGVYSDKIVLRCDDDEASTIFLEASCEVLGDFLVEPASIFWGEVGRLPVSREVKILRRKGSSATISSTRSTDPSLSVVTTPDENGYRLQLALETSALPRGHKLSSQIVLSLDQSDQKEIRIPVHGLVVEE